MGPLPSNRQHLSYDVCLAVRGEIIRTVLCYCVLKLCTVISTLRWAVLTVLWIGFCLTGTISLCVDLFVFVCICVFCFILNSCCIIVSKVGWTWSDRSLILRTVSSFSALTLLVGSFDPWKRVPDMTYNVFGGTLSLTQSINRIQWSL